MLVRQWFGWEGWPVERRGVCRCPLANVCNRVSGPFREVRKPQHNILYVQGTPASQVYLLHRGTVSLHRMSGENMGLGRTRELRHAGAFLGIESWVDETYQDSARAETDLLLCVVARERVTEWLGDRQTPSALVLEAMLRSSGEQELSRSSPDGTAAQRVATWLLDQHDQEKRTDVPRKVVAELLGMRAETLSRVLHALSDEGLIEVSRRTLYIVDARALRKKLQG